MMYHSRINPAALTVKTVSGFPCVIDTLAQAGLSSHHFLRASWFAAAAPEGGETLVIEREDGAALAAIPTVSFGPELIGARKVPGCYWPFRGIVAAADASAPELASALCGSAAKALGPVWRLGPVPDNDQVTQLLIQAARQAGWHVLRQAAGTIWEIDLDAARTQGWPLPSTAKRLGRAERRLDKLGKVEWRYVQGNDWSEATLEHMAAVERASWIASETDGSGAKFMQPQQRALWRGVLNDPVLADMLCATLLMIDGRAVAFSLDLDDGPVQYGIAGSYVSALGKYEIGKLVNYRTITDAIADGQSRLDLGAGDSGYKREMGAVAAYELSDYLFVRSRIAARVLGPWWRRQGV
jgi:CelD/BcsL family acetyltransferase involved in cellulose biosynthesis